MGVKFWTTIVPGEARGGGYSHRQNNGFILSQKGTLEASLCRSKTVVPTNELINSTSLMLVLVQPTAEDFAALGNALVAGYGAPGSNDLMIALSPLTLAATVGDRKRRVEFGNNWAVKGWYASWGKTLRLYRDGQPGSLCAGCPKILHRASGACDPLFTCCDRTFYSDYLTSMPKIKMPPVELYIPLKECCQRKPFASYQIANIDVDRISTTTRITPEDNSHAAFKAATTRYAKKLFCPACIFANAPGSKRSCAGGLHARHCGGPYLDSDIPMPEERTRKLIRLTDVEIAWETYKTAASKRSWVQKRWRNNPCFVTGFIQRKPLSLGILRTWSCDNNYANECTPVADEQFIIDTLLEYQAKQPIPPKASLIERLVCYALEKGKLYRRNERRGWGGSSWSQLLYVRYNDKSNTALERHFLRNGTSSDTLTDAKDMIAAHPGIGYDLVPDRRALADLLERRHGPLNPLQVVPKAIELLVDADRKIQLLGTGSMPPISEIVRQAKLAVNSVT